MKFLCGRPGCGKESTATLQIDAPSETVSLVDPRISRDGVPLCARHADATTPPVGWTMNDLRSRNRALSAVPDEGSIPTSTPPRVRPEAAPPSERPMTAGPASGAPGTGAPARSGATDPAPDVSQTPDPAPDVSQAPDHSTTPDPATTPEQPATPKTMPRRQSIAERVRQTDDVDDVDDGDRVSARSTRTTTADDAPESRPTRRRDVPEEEAEAEERFPWHHQYHDDEPEEMQASSPLLSRAFRSSTG